jgi:hypothetical protein
MIKPSPMTSSNKVKKIKLIAALRGSDIKIFEVFIAEISHYFGKF